MRETLSEVPGLSWDRFSTHPSPFFLHRGPHPKYFLFDNFFQPGHFFEVGSTTSLAPALSHFSFVVLRFGCLAVPFCHFLPPFRCPRREEFLWPSPFPASEPLKAYFPFSSDPSLPLPNKFRCLSLRYPAWQPLLIDSFASCFCLSFFLSALAFPLLSFVFCFRCDSLGLFQ